MDPINTELMNLLAREDHNSSYIYPLLANLKSSEDDLSDMEIITKLYLLYDRGFLRKDLVLLSLMLNENDRIFQKLLEFESSVLVLNLEDSRTLFDFTHQKNKHWFLEVIERDFPNLSNVFNESMQQKIYLMKLFHVTNLPNVDLEHIEVILDKFNLQHADTFIQTYIAEIKQRLHVIKYCLAVNEGSLDESELYYYLSNHSLLQTLLKYTDFKKLEYWPEINKLISQQELFIKSIYPKQNNKAMDNYSESETFAVFCVLFNVLKCIKLCHESTENNARAHISGIMEETKHRIFQIENDNLLIETLENIFSLIFLREEHLLSTKVATSSFFCLENELFLIVKFLKSALTEVRRSRVLDKNSELYQRLFELTNYTTDALWRLELITGIGKCKEENANRNVLPYMLAPPESLINICLKKDDFEKANQVVKIFNLKDTYLVKEIEHTEKLRELKENLQKTLKLKDIKKEYAFSQDYDTSMEKVINEHFKNSTFINEELDEIVDRFKEDSHLLHYHSKHGKFMDVFDVALACTRNYEESLECLNVASKYCQLSDDEKSPFSTFFDKLSGVLKVSKDLSLSDILLNPAHNLDITKQRKYDDIYSQLIEYYDSFAAQTDSKESGSLNPNHAAHKIFLKLQELALGLMKIKHDYTDDIENFKYLQRLYSYLKAFSKIFYIEANNSHILSQGKQTSFFDILRISKHELVGKLLFEKNLLPTDLERFFVKMKLDLSYHIAANCFPVIYLNSEEQNPAKKLNKPNISILSYIQKRNWLLGFIINEVHKIESTNINVNESRVKHIVNYVRLPAVQHLKELYDNNEFIAALHHRVDDGLIDNYFEEAIKKYDTEDAKNAHIADLSTESCEEASEGFLRTTDWKHLFNVVDNIPQLQLQQSSVLKDLRDMVLCNLVTERYETDYYKYVQYILDDDLRINITLCYMMHWPGHFCMDILLSELSRFKEIDKNYRTILTDWHVKIKLYEQLKCVFPHKSWHDIKELCDENPSKVLTNLLQKQEVDVLLYFIEIQKPDEQLVPKIDLNYFMSLFDANVPLNKIEALFVKLPQQQTTEICQNLLRLLRKLDFLQFITNYLLKTTKEDIVDLRNIKISLKILSSVPQCDQDQLWCLIYEPVSILEVFLMNTKLDKVGHIIDSIKPDLTHCEFDENVISTEKIDEILRRYAEKSLDFRIITQPNPRLLRTPESKLMQSLDSLNVGPEKRSFEMPEMVPDKSEWVENSEVIECMCCEETTFSMFNRRHHCRRCGRIVCWSCSTKRMLVPTYEDILVRVCSDCYEQTHSDGGTSSRSDSIMSSFCDAWLLTDDPEHNHVIREEFSYEHAPSVSLCLAILKNHSKSVEYPTFLLKQCDDMLKLLHPLHSDSGREIDFMLVIKMLKSLAMAAKMLCAESTLQWGVTLADRILTQADLLALLVERGCLSLLPHPTQKNSPYIDSAVLRRLRDRLLEREQWNLALEVSTKAGLDNTGVFAAWGKSCLKAGSLLVAREKFQRCFDKILHSTSDYFLTSESESSQDSIRLSRNLRKSSSSDVKPVRNPPLLKEIIQILESNCTPMDKQLLKDANSHKLQKNLNLSQGHGSSLQSDLAISVLNKLKNLNTIAAGNYYCIPDDKKSATQKGQPFMEPIFYKECIFYLQKYGSHVSLLQFYIKLGEFHDALLYIIENQLSVDTFVEIYMICLKSGLVNKLQENMSSMDSSLNLWKDYLNHICRHLEKQSLLHSLYQLQQFMCDYVRASMTCVRFYVENVSTFTELTNNVKYLYKSQMHLRQELEQEQWVEVTAVQNATTSSVETYEEKAVVNPSLILKMDSKNIERCMDIIHLQIDTAQFLSECELKKPIVPLIPTMSIYCDEGKCSVLNPDTTVLPTLIYNTMERIQMAVLAIVAGEKVIDGFGFAYKIIQTCKLKAVKVYCQAGKILAEEKRYSGLAQLVGCIHNTGNKDSAVTYECDEMLLLAVRTLSNSSFEPSQVDELVKFITDKGTKVNAYIECKQLKSAFMLALKYNRAVDIRRIMHEAELLNKPDVRKLCKKALVAHAHSPPRPKGSKTHSK